MNNTIKIILAAIAIVLIIMTSIDIATPSYGFFAKVNAGYVGIVTYFGKIEDRVLPAGFHVTKYFEHVHPINVRTQMRKGQVIAFSSDIQQVVLDISINYNVTPEAANTLYKTISGDYFSTLIAPRVNENVKVVVSNYTAENLVSNREVLSKEVLKLMQDDLKDYGITASSISIENIDFTDAFESAVEAKQVATQEAKRAKTMQDQQTMEAEQAAARKKIEADAEAEVIRKQADAKAYETKVKADAESEANRKLVESITPDLINYIQAQGWDGKLPATYMGDSSALPIINTDPILFGEFDPNEEIDEK